MHLEGWDLLSSYFTYRNESDATNFGYHSPNRYGIDEELSTPQLPILNYAILINRHLYGTLIHSILPVMVILILLFVTLLTASSLSLLQIFGIVSSLLFSILVAYNAFTASLPIQEIVFFDYLYYLAELVVVIVAIFSIAYSRYASIDKNKDILLVHLLFWPLIMSVILILSLIFFY